MPFYHQGDVLQPGMVGTRAVNLPNTDTELAKVHRAGPHDDQPCLVSAPTHYEPYLPTA